MKKRREPDKYEPLALFRMLLYFPTILFISSLARGIWYYRLLPDVVPPLIPVLWPFSVPLPRTFYLLLPLIAGVVLSANGIWVRQAGTPRIDASVKRPSAVKASKEEPYSGFRAEEMDNLERELDAGKKAGMERIRKVLSHPVVVSFLLQVIAVSLYAYVQETLLSRLAGGTQRSFILSYVYGWILTLSLSTFLFSIIIRMYRKDHGLS